LLGADWQRQHFLDAIPPNDCRHADRDIRDAILALQWATDGENRMLIAKNRFDYRQQAQPNRVVCSLFALDNLIGGGARLLENRVERSPIVAATIRADKIAQIDSGNVSQAPERQLAIAMLSDDISMHAARVYAIIIAKHIAKTRRVE